MRRMRYHIERSSGALYLQLSLRRPDMNWYVVTIRKGEIYREPGVVNPVPFPIDGLGKIEEDHYID